MPFMLINICDQLATKATIDARAQKKAPKIRQICQHIKKQLIRKINEISTDLEIDKKNGDRFSTITVKLKSLLNNKLY